MHAAQTLTANRGPERTFAAATSRAPVIDLVHLARQTDGDAALEAELLALFDKQAANLFARLSADSESRMAKADLAHKLRGSALAIGAGQVASTAQDLETALESDLVGSRERDEALAALSAAVADARAAIAALRG
jgi:HPt (histidine-containing phosphotransfer) domain-containing protein